MRIQIVVCENEETLECSAGSKTDFCAKAIDIAIDAGFDVKTESSFRHWNGGPGARDKAYVRLTGYGRVHNFERAKRAIAFYLVGGGEHSSTKAAIPEDWPNASELNTAFAAVEEIRNIEIPDDRDE